MFLQSFKRKFHQIHSQHRRSFGGFEHKHSHHHRVGLLKNCWRRCLEWFPGIARYQRFGGTPWAGDRGSAQCFSVSSEFSPFLPTFTQLGQSKNDGEWGKRIKSVNFQGFFVLREFETNNQPHWSSKKKTRLWEVLETPLLVYLVSFCELTPKKAELYSYGSYGFILAHLGNRPSPTQKMGFNANPIFSRKPKVLLHTVSQVVRIFGSFHWFLFSLKTLPPPADIPRVYRVKAKLTIHHQTALLQSSNWEAFRLFSCQTSIVSATPLVDSGFWF